MFLDHTQRRATVGRTPLDEWPILRRDLYLTTHNIHNRQTSMPRWDSNPQSQQASGLRLRGHWDRHGTYRAQWNFNQYCEEVLRCTPTTVFVPCYSAFPTLPAINIFACITSLRGHFDIPPLTCNNQPAPRTLHFWSKWVKAVHKTRNPICRKASKFITLMKK